MVNGSTVIANVEVGAVTSGRLNSACALIGTSSNASTSGQTTGPPAENAYAVEPVGVAQTTPSQPYRDSGRPSTSTSSSSIWARCPFSTLTSLSAHDSTTWPPGVELRPHVQGQPLVHRVVAVDHVPDRLVEVVDLGLGQEADLAEVDPEQRRLRRPGQLRGAQERAVAAEREHDLGALGGVLAAARHHAGQVEVVGLVGDHPHLETGPDQIGGHRTGVLGAPPPPGVGDQQGGPAHARALASRGPA